MSKYEGGREEVGSYFHLKKRKSHVMFTFQNVQLVKSKKVTSQDFISYSHESSLTSI
jgi:hypothetical protein